MSFYLKDPHSRVDYAIDWSSDLAGRTIEGSLWSVEPDEDGGIALEDTSLEPGRTGARLGGGLTGHRYSVCNRVTLSNGTIEVRSINLRVEPR